MFFQPIVLQAEFSTRSENGLLLLPQLEEVVSFPSREQQAEPE